MTDQRTVVVFGVSRRGNTLSGGAVVFGDAVVLGDVVLPGRMTTLPPSVELLDDDESSGGVHPAVSNRPVAITRPRQSVVGFRHMVTSPSPDLVGSRFGKSLSAYLVPKLQLGNRHWRAALHCCLDPKLELGIQGKSRK